MNEIYGGFFKEIDKTHFSYSERSQISKVCMNSDKNMLLNLKEQTQNPDQKQHSLQNVVQSIVNMKKVPGENILNQIFYFKIRESV